MKYLFLAFALALLLPVQAQNFVLPDGEMKTAEDYSKHTDVVRKAMKWLIENPLNKAYPDQVKTNRFVLQWLTGSPQVRLTVRPEVLGNLAAERNFPYGPQMTLIYLSGMGLKALENAHASEKELQLAGAEALLQAYANLKNEYKSTHLKKLAKLKEKGRLETWIEEVVKDAGANDDSAFSNQ